MRGCAARGIPVEEQSSLRTDVMANVTANNAAKFKKMQAEALTLELAFYESHGWDGQSMTPKGALNHSKTSTA